MAKASELNAAIEKAPETRERTNVLASLLNSVSIRQKFEDVLGSKAPGFISSILSAVNANQQLKICEPMTVISSAAVAASLDLPINPSLGFAHIVPYSGKAQFQMGWRGYVQLAMRSGQYRTMNVTEVYEGEIKNHNRITGEMEFDQAGKKSDTIIGYVAYFKLLNGFEKYNYMSKEAALAHGRKYSKSFSSDNGKWKLDPDAMSKKTVLKMLLSKFGILSVEMQKAIQSDQAVIRENGSPEYVDGTEEAQVIPENGNGKAHNPSAEIGESETALLKQSIAGSETKAGLDKVLALVKKQFSEGSITEAQHIELVSLIGKRVQEITPAKGGK